MFPHAHTTTTHERRKRKTNKPTYPNTELPNNTCTHKVKILFIHYKTHTVLNLILARIGHEIGYFTVILPLFQPLSLSCFEHIACILHHFAFLVCRQLAIFSPPITHFQTLKTHFLRVILPFFAMFFIVREGFIYTTSVDIYAFRPTFSGKSHCILHHFTLRLAPKRVAFSTKTQCI